jgi:hypothetical protein
MKRERILELLQLMERQGKTIPIELLDEAIRQDIVLSPTARKALKESSTDE